MTLSLLALKFETDAVHCPPICSVLYIVSTLVQVQLSSSNSGRCMVSDLWHDIKQELDCAGIMLEPEQKPTLLQLCLQCSERSPEELGRREVCPPAYKLSLRRPCGQRICTQCRWEPCMSSDFRV